MCRVDSSRILATGIDTFAIVLILVISQARLCVVGRSLSEVIRAEIRMIAELGYIEYVATVESATGVVSMPIGAGLW